MQIFDNKNSWKIGLVGGFVIYLGLIILMPEVSRIRIHWMGALLLEIGGPHLLAAVIGLIGGAFFALLYDTRKK